MTIDATGRAMLFAVCLLSVGCQRKIAEKEPPLFRIIVTDAGFEAPDGVAAGLRHIVFENRGSEIHEAMLVKLPKDMSANDYVAAVKAGSLFPEGALDYSGPGTNIARRDRRDVVKGGLETLHPHLLEWRSRQDYSRPPL